MQMINPALMLRVLKRKTQSGTSIPILWNGNFDYMIMFHPKIFITNEDTKCFGGR
ncbi:Uncharacterised protein [Klebsiella michiganensis]|nr:Uncharacterised protein [Klebsiella michiganensis]